LIHKPVPRVKRNMDKDTLYYDGACPVCSAEMGKLARFSRGRIELKNIHELDDDAGLDKDKLLSRLHLRTAEGEWVTGLKANIRAWHHTPFRHLWRVLDWPLIRPVSQRCYEYWLRHRAR
jgi:predicted DCC family thiol-disulfide oxidoreductase YuxK